MWEMKMNEKIWRFVKVDCGMRENVGVYGGLGDENVLEMMEEKINDGILV